MVKVRSDYCYHVIIPLIVLWGVFMRFGGYYLILIDSISLIIRAWLAAWFRVGWIVSSYKRVGSLRLFVHVRSRYTGRVNEFVQYVGGGDMGVILIVIIMV